MRAITLPGLDELMERGEALQEAGGDGRRRAGWRQREVGGAGGCGAGGQNTRATSGRSNMERKDAHASTMEVRSLGSELEPVVPVPAFDGGDALCVHARRPGVFFDAGLDAGGRKGVEEGLVVGGPDALRRPLTASGIPAVVEQTGLAVPGYVQPRSDDEEGWRRAVERAGLFDLLADALGVDGAVVEVAERDPLIGERAVEFDQPADEVGVRLLQKGSLLFAEELVGRDATVWARE